MRSRRSWEIRRQPAWIGPGAKGRRIENRARIDEQRWQEDHAVKPAVASTPGNRKERPGRGERGLRGLHTKEIGTHCAAFSPVSIAWV
jgi:hypothetical protein